MSMKGVSVASLKSMTFEATQEAYNNAICTLNNEFINGDLDKDEVSSKIYELMDERADLSKLSVGELSARKDKVQLEVDNFLKEKYKNT